MNIPNKLSILRICMVPLFCVFFFVPAAWCPYVAVLVFALAAFTDFLDGFIARKYNLVSDLGKLLDPIADKILVTAALFCLVATNPLRLCTIPSLLGNVDLLTWLTTPILVGGSILIITRELLISAVRMIAAAKGVVVQANMLGKIKTVLLDVALPVLVILQARSYQHSLPDIFYDVLWCIGLALLYAATVMTVVSGVVYLVQNKGVFEQKPTASLSAQESQAVDISPEDTPEKG